MRRGPRTAIVEREQQDDDHLAPALNHEEQVLNTLALTARRAEPYFLLTSDGYEIDLLLEMGRERWAVEIKLTSAPSPQDLERLDRAADLVRARKRIVVSQVRVPAFSERRISCDLPSFLAFLRG